MIDPKNYIAAGVALALVAAGWFSHAWYTDSNTLRIERATNAAVSAASKATAEQIAGIKIINTQVMGKVVERIKVEKIYVECRHSPETFQIIKQTFE